MFLIASEYAWIHTALIQLLLHVSDSHTHLIPELSSSPCVWWWCSGRRQSEIGRLKLLKQLVDTANAFPAQWVRLALMLTDQWLWTDHPISRCYRMPSDMEHILLLTNCQWFDVAAQVIWKLLFWPLCRVGLGRELGLLSIRHECDTHQMNVGIHLW